MNNKQRYPIFEHTILCCKLPTTFIQRKFCLNFFSSISEPYVPVAASVALPPMHLPPPGYPSEAVDGLNRKRPFHELASEFNAYPPQKRFDFNRLGRGRPMLRGVRGGRGRGGRGGFNSESGNLTPQLAVRNIPPPINTIAHLNNHFARFGSLVNVQVQFEGDPASALVRIYFYQKNFV